MATTMKRLPARASATLQALIRQAGPVSAATRALLWLGAEAAGLAIPPPGRREIAVLLAVEALAPDVLAALQRLYDRLEVRNNARDQGRGSSEGGTRGSTEGGTEGGAKSPIDPPQGRRPSPNAQLTSALDSAAPQLAPEMMVADDLFGDVGMEFASELQPPIERAERQNDGDD